MKSLIKNSRKAHDSYFSFRTEERKRISLLLVVRTFYVNIILLASGLQT